MRLKSADLVLLTNVCSKLSYLGETEQAEELREMIERLKSSRQVEREKCRRRAAANRRAGYAWKSSAHPKRSKWYENKKITSVPDTADYETPPDEGYYDEVGGYHDCATGTSPSGKYCGECCRTSCADCSVYLAEKGEQ